MEKTSSRGKKKEIQTKDLACKGVIELLDLTNLLSPYITTVFKGDGGAEKTLNCYYAAHP